MNKIIILVGENISDVEFSCGGSSVEGLQFPEWSSNPVWVHWTNSTSRKCPENSKHPKVYQKWLTKDVDYAIKYWNYIIATNSSNTIDILCRLVYDGVIQPEQLVIHGLDAQNKEIIFTSTLDSDKHYLHNWPYGFLNIE